MKTIIYFFLLLLSINVMSGCSFFAQLFGGTEPETETEDETPPPVHSNLIITEVGNQFYSDANTWIEVYNPSSSRIAKPAGLHLGLLYRHLKWR